MENKPLTVNELREAFFSLKTNESTGYDDICSNIVKKLCRGLMWPTITHINRLSSSGIYLDSLKIGNVTLICTPWTQDVNWTYIRRLEDIQDVFWTSYVRSIYVLCPGGKAVVCYAITDHYLPFHAGLRFSNLLCITEYIQKRPTDVFCKKVVFRNFANS